MGKKKERAKGSTGLGGEIGNVTVQTMVETHSKKVKRVVAGTIMNSRDCLEVMTESLSI
jgi:hypothetical protein